MSILDESNFLGHLWRYSLPHMGSTIINGLSCLDLGEFFLCSSTADALMLNE